MPRQPQPPRPLSLRLRTISELQRSKEGLRVVDPLTPRL
jgi:hypothetical protein